MIFPLELCAKKFSGNLGPKCREYVERIHERYVFQTPPPPSLQLDSDDNTRPAFKRVRVALDSFSPLYADSIFPVQSIEKGGEYALL